MPCEGSRIIVPNATLVTESAVPLSVILERRDHCRECEHATRSPDPRFAVNKGLTSNSICELVKAREPDKPANIKYGTTLPEARCPIKRFGPFRP